MCLIGEKLMETEPVSDRSPAATAYRYWDELWRSAPQTSRWSEADPWVAGVIPVLRDRGASRVLDLGCGLGRHAVAFATAGFATFGLDASGNAIAVARDAAHEAGVHVDLRLGGLDALPYEDGFFDYVLAFNVVYHGTGDDLLTTLGEVRRVLRQEGLYQSTMLSKRNVEYGRGIQIAPNTFVQPDGPGDKSHPHFFCDAGDLLRLHDGLDLLSLMDADQTGNHEYHWHCLFEAAR
jgi:tellurite methyltransferase